MPGLAIPVLLQLAAACHDHGVPATTVTRPAGWVYLITNTVNGRQYVGIARDPAKRWRSHLASLGKGDTRPLYAGMRKYGLDSFQVEVIACSATWEGLLDTERAMIAQIGSYRFDRNGYNLTRGGDGVLGMRHSPEGIERLRAAMVGRVVTEQTRAKLRARVLSPEHLALLRARMRDPETRRKNAIAAKGRKMPPSPKKGCKLSPEQVAGMRERATGKRHTEEARAKMRAARANQTIPPEQRQKIAETNRLTWMRRREEMDRSTHPRARAVITPFGTFPSCVLAAEAVGIASSKIYARAFRRMDGWEFVA